MYICRLEEQSGGLCHKLQRVQERASPDNYEAICAGTKVTTLSVLCLHLTSGTRISFRLAHNGRHIWLQAARRWERRKSPKESKYRSSRGFKKYIAQFPISLQVLDKHMSCHSENVVFYSVRTSESSCSLLFIFVTNHRRHAGYSNFIADMR